MGDDKSMKKVCLDLHDFSVVNNRLLWLLALKEHFPNFRVSLFMIPVDVKSDWGPYLLREEFLEEIHRHLDWIQLIPHGLHHPRNEMARADFMPFKQVTIPAIEDAFNKDGLPFEKGFCAPHWRWSDAVVRTLDDLGWWGAVDRDKKMPYPKRFYKYNYLLNEPFWEAEEDLKIHGHIYGTKNDVGLCFENLLKLPEDTEWHFVTDFLEDRDG